MYNLYVNPDALLTQKVSDLRTNAIDLKSGKCLP